MQSSAQKLRYVVLHHEGFGDPHYDFMLESSPGSALMTWRAKEWPLVAGDELTRIANHRPDYLEYEGPVPNNRGNVRRVTSGTCDVSYAKSQISVELLEPETMLIMLTHLRENYWQVVEVSE